MATATDLPRQIRGSGMTPTRARALEFVRQVVAEGLAGHPARVFLFGSSARGDALMRSDIDVAVLPLEPLPFAVMARIAGDLDESWIPYTVDLVNLAEASDEMRGHILEHAVEWPM